MRLDPDIKDMTGGQARQELMRARRILRTWRGLENHRRCHHADEEMCNRILPDKKPLGRMNLPKRVLLNGCARYISRQQCPDPCPVRERKGEARGRT